MLLKDYLRDGERTLGNLYPAAEARSIMLLLCGSLIGTKSYTHIIEPAFTIPEKEEPALREALLRLSAGEPVQYVIGRTEFCGEFFNVTPDVLIPRPETEMLCREAISSGSRMARMRSAFGKAARPVRVLDLCTGSGCIAWSVAMNIPGAEVTGVDISDAALEVARSQSFPDRFRNPEFHPPHFRKADVLDPGGTFDEGPFDLILSNPPYVKDSQKAKMRPNVLDYEPHLALFVPDEDPLLFYRAIASISYANMAEQGEGLTEINDLLASETAGIFTAAGFRRVSILKDLSDRNRFISYAR
ncbi:MAG: peptide chain release factor N(5)-glutamine methyltransferase [Candidatus Cryptobacteroides sp.]